MRNHPFFIKLFNWEYWPIWLTNIPVLFFALSFAIRARRIGFFTAVNPTIETGGLFGESKINILNQIPNKYLPKTIFLSPDTDFEVVKYKIRKAGIDYPLIAKPDIGERGLLVAKIKNEVELETYLKDNPVNFLIQEFLDLPLEWAVMHHRFPEVEEGKITSICIKDSLKITGDGSTTIAQLMQAIPRAILQLPRFQKQRAQLLYSIPKKGEIIELEPIGNHNLGTMFLNGNHLVNEKTNAIFNQISNQMEGIYYGRFDLKCASAKAVEQGDFKIMEYNGIGAEPAHIYDPSYPLWKKYRDIYQHWKIIFEISKVQQKRGFEGDSLPEIKKMWRNYNAYIKSIQERSNNQLS